MSKVTHSDLAKMLDGHDSKDKFTKYVLKMARDSRLIILTTIGDDVLNFSGFMHDEADCLRGGDVFLKIESGECIVYTKKKDDSKKICSFWDNKSIFKWKFLTNIPNSKFSYTKDGKRWCEAIIFSVDDI